MQDSPAASLVPSPSAVLPFNKKSSGFRELLVHPKASAGLRPCSCAEVQQPLGWHAAFCGFCGTFSHSIRCCGRLEEAIKLILTVNRKSLLHVCVLSREMALASLGSRVNMGPLQTVFCYIYLFVNTQQHPPGDGTAGAATPTTVEGRVLSYSRASQRFFLNILLPFPLL